MIRIITKKNGWYFYCHRSTLVSGPPHNCRWPGKEYGPRIGYGDVHTGSTVGVVMDTSKGELSFVLDGVNLGVAFEGIPLDKPFVPCVIVGYKDDSVELDTSDVKENVDSSISIPLNISAKSSAAWDSITLTWDAVDGASFYQIKVNESKSLKVSTANTFTVKGLYADTGYDFWVRTVKNNSVSEWSSAVKERTQKTKVFSGCVWGKCPDYVNSMRKYSVDDSNPRVATSTSKDYSTIIGDAFIPLNKITQWGIKILKGSNVWMGVAPADIDQDDNENIGKCGWFFNCLKSVLISGPPHSYVNRVYGPRKEIGEYVKMGDTIGVVMDTTKGELSFVISETNLGVAYEGIPLDKPLVPCVILLWEGDSVEFCYVQNEVSNQPCIIS